MKPLVIYFDIDFTVFTTHLFKKTRIDPQLAELFQVPLAQISQVERTYFQGLEKSTDFNYQEYSQFLAEQFLDKDNEVSSAEVEAFFENPQMYQDMLYPDVLPTLHDLRQRGCILGIYSEGFEDFQKKKIEYTGIRDFFDPAYVHIARRKKKPAVVSQLQVPSVLIDDKPEYLEGLPQGITPLLIQRETASESSTAHVIHSLEEIVRFL